MQRPWYEDAVCFLCDYGLYALLLTIIASFALSRFLITPTAPLPVPILGPTPTTVSPTEVGEIISTATPPADVVPTPAVASPTPHPKSFTVALIPINWQGSLDEFPSQARAQSEIFRDESGIQNYLVFKTITAEDTPMTGQDLTDPALIDLLLSFALEKGIQADRYVGLTNADLAPDGYSNVVGWTSGESSMVAEVQDPYVTAHELGHTFGLCDEYNYADWLRQDGEYSGGCPNPYPQNCSLVLTDGGVTCDGQPSADGSNSIMGPAGLSGEYSYNEASFAHLQSIFSALASQENQP